MGAEQLKVREQARDTVIRKVAGDLHVSPNMAEYEPACAAFDWASVRAESIGPAGDCNLARLAVDRHAEGARANRIALRFLARDAEPRGVTYAELKRLSNRFANGLSNLGVGAGNLKTEALYLRKNEQIRASLPTLEFVIVIGEGGTNSAISATHDYSVFMSRASEHRADTPTPESQPALLHFTSGTTGRPEGAGGRRLCARRVD